MTEQIKLDEEKDKVVLDSWMEEAKKGVISVDDFIKRIEEQYEHDYGTIVHAMHAVMKAAMVKLNNGPQGGITGFQASCLGWMLIRDCFLTGDSPLRLVKYEEMLYPQYREKFQPTIDPGTWGYLQKKAKEELAKDLTNVSPTVVEHWQTIVAGIVPFGYTVGKED